MSFVILQAYLEILEGSYLAIQPQIRISNSNSEGLWNNCIRCGSLTMHIQRRRIMDERILRGFVSYNFRRLVVTTRDKCGFRRDLRIYIY